MSVLPASLNQSLLPRAVTEEGSGNFSAHEKTQWDSSDFATLFDKALLHRALQPAMLDASSQREHLQDESRGPPLHLQSGASPAGKAANLAPAMTAINEQSSGNPLSAPDGSRVDSEIVAGGGAFANTEPVLGQELSGADGAVFSTAPAQLDASGARVTVRMSGNGAAVWVQDIGIAENQFEQVRGVIAAELSWAGIALAGLKVNGRELVKSLATVRR